MFRVEKWYCAKRLEKKTGFLPSPQFQSQAYRLWADQLYIGTVWVLQTIDLDLYLLALSAIAIAIAMPFHVWSGTWQRLIKTFCDTQFSKR